MIQGLRCRISAHFEAMEGPLTLKEDPGKLWERAHHASVCNALNSLSYPHGQTLSGSSLYLQCLANHRLDTRVHEGML